MIFLGTSLADILPAVADNDAQELTKMLSNPIVSLISMPLQSIYDDGCSLGDSESCQVR